MATFKAKDGTQIYYKDCGAGKPVLFSHGWPLDGDMWDSQLNYLAERGFGGKILPSYSRYEAVADNAETLLSLLDLELTAGQMSASTKAAITEVMNTLPVTLPNARRLRVWKAVYLVMTSPEYVVQR